MLTKDFQVQSGALDFRDEPELFMNFLGHLGVYRARNIPVHVQIPILPKCIALLKLVRPCLQEFAQKNFAAQMGMSRFERIGDITIRFAIWLSFALF